LKVAYVHDGSEETSDTVGIQLEFRGVLDDDLDAIKKYGFTMVIQIAPWNDKPEIVLAADDTFVVIASTQLKVSF